MERNAPVSSRHHTKHPHCVLRVLAVDLCISPSCSISPCGLWAMCFDDFQISTSRSSLFLDLLTSDSNQMSLESNITGKNWIYLTALNLITLQCLGLFMNWIPWLSLPETVILNDFCFHTSTWNKFLSLLLHLQPVHHQVLLILFDSSDIHSVFFLSTVTSVWATLLPRFLQPFPRCL